MRAFTFSDSRLARLPRYARETDDLVSVRERRYDCPPGADASSRGQMQRHAGCSVALRRCKRARAQRMHRIIVTPSIESEWKRILTLLWQFIRVLNTPITYQCAQECNMIYKSGKPCPFSVTQGQIDDRRYAWGRIIFEV